jgi:ribulose 1,5-bisphosphate synthetase/thiazole synthase
MPSRDPDYKEDVPLHIFAPGRGFKYLDIAIVGACIAGLGSAIGLCQSGHKVEVRSLHMYQLSATYKGNMD